MNIKLEIKSILHDSAYYPQLHIPAPIRHRLQQIFNFLERPPRHGNFEIVEVSPERMAAYQAIRSERDHQDEQWGKTQSSGRPGNGERSLDEFALYISGYADTLRGFCTEFTDANTKLHAVRKIAALCVWCMEQHGALPRDMSKTKVISR